ncbi:MAG: PEGA domain-containing protein [Candidatus Marinimicrobia bacterium]|nr:PEGA domain-containing protein [Candidatus Neomarinimicrobiota bacterium]
MRVFPVVFVFVLSFTFAGVIPQDTTVVDTSAVRNGSEEKIPVAVMDLDANNVGESEAKALSDRLRIEIFRVGKFEVMERQRMQDILNEMKFQLSGTTTDADAIQIGKMIGVKKIVAGSIGKVGDIYTLSVRLIDIETGKIEKTSAVDVYGTVTTVLQIAIPIVAQDICGKSRREAFGMLCVDSEPRGVEVYINEAYKGETPVNLTLSPGKNYKLTLLREGYKKAERAVFLAKNQILELRVALEKVPVEEKIVPQPVQRPVVERSDKSYDKGFKVCYTVMNDYRYINRFIEDVNRIASTEKLFKEKIEHFEFPEVTSFSGVEFFNVDRDGSFDFGIGIFRADIVDWLNSLMGEEKEEDEYKMEIWNPRLTFNICVSPIRYILFYPYFNLGVGYNVLIVNVRRGNTSLGGPTYQSWGVTYGLGFEIRPIKLFGMAVEWNRRKMNMKIMDINKITRRFEERGFKSLDISGDHISVSVVFYY